MDGEGASVSDAVAAWDFSRNMAMADVVDSGPSGRQGRLHNLPTRAVKGSHWCGTEQSYLHAPRQYAAIHFHQDDLSDAKWPVAARLCLPDTLETGVYLIEVSGESGRDTLPVVVRQKKAKKNFAFLASTFTWLAYANDRCLLHGSNPEMFANRLLILTQNDCELASDHRYGLSLYDTHMDDSGVSYATRRRPCLSFRHSQRGWHGGIGSSLWNFGIDLLILAWLQREGIAYDIVTDDDLDKEGPASLSPYRCVMTGCHPEYHTQRSADAVRGFIETGGRFIYLGGNGFYWRVSTHPDYPETVELRRAEDGNRSWASEPGEYYHAFDGAYGGLWRRNGQPPQALLGVGYCGQGFYKCHPFRLNAAASDPRVAFLMDAPPVTGSLLGDFGLVGGGAVGLEIDRADRHLGTPDHALVLATSVPLDDSYILANEEVGVNRPTVSGAMSAALRADLVFFETPAGGAVLSTGSISWAGSMSKRRNDNPVSTLTRNAIRRFSDPVPFTMPSV
ncbi:MAG: N,N-dimethylformamidase large subunit [Proteobacteria bacterium]|nr:N,N-dimethylformamidase large subunit [Pseudomonadota bacterium]